MYRSIEILKILEMKLRSSFAIFNSSVESTLLENKILTHKKALLINTKENANKTL